jgi:hypothetical protein
MRHHYGASGYTPKEKTMDPAFEVHMLNEDGKGKANVIACKFHELLCGLEGIGIGPSHEMSIVKTKLEEACFFAKKAMANQKENQA